MLLFYQQKEDLSAFLFPAARSALLILALVEIKSLDFFLKPTPLGTVCTRSVQQVWTGLTN